MNEQALQEALARLIEAEVLYRRGPGLQARYVFKHALIQDAAYLPTEEYAGAGSFPDSSCA